MGLFLYRGLDNGQWTKTERQTIEELHEKYRKRVWNTGWYFYITASGGPESNIYITIHKKTWSNNIPGSYYQFKERFKLLNILDELTDMKLTELGI